MKAKCSFIVAALLLPSSAFSDDLCANKYRPPFGEAGDVEQCRIEQTAGKKFVWDWLGKNGVKSQAQLEEATRQKQWYAQAATLCIERGDNSDWAVAAFCLKTALKRDEEQ